MLLYSLPAAENILRICSLHVIVFLNKCIYSPVQNVIIYAATNIPEVDLERWRLRIMGLVRRYGA